MPGVRRISDWPQRYIVTFTSRPIMDASVFSVVHWSMEKNQQGWRCNRHRSRECECIACVLAAIEADD